MIDYNYAYGNNSQIVCVQTDMNYDKRNEIVPYWSASFNKASYQISKVMVLRTNVDPGFTVDGDEISFAGILIED